jgi:Dual OB-containing domain
MKTSLVITDVTRMQEGRVCIAGYDKNSKCIRPVLPPPGIHERTLYAQGHAIVFPFAVVEYDLLQPTPQPPHTEDYRYGPTSVRFVERLDEKGKRAILTRTVFRNVPAIFEAPIYSDVGHYVMDGQGPRSLGTIQPRQILKAIYEQSPEEKCKYRLGFVDGEGATYWLTVTDLAWRYYCDYQRQNGRDPRGIASELTAVLKSSQVYLRIGLARGWKEYPDRCFIQMTGVYTFPDYLDGRTFADFAPKPDGK